MHHVLNTIRVDGRNAGHRVLYDGLFSFGLFRLCCNLILYWVGWGLSAGFVGEEGVLKRRAVLVFGWVALQSLL